MDADIKKIVDEEMKKYYEPVPRESGYDNFIVPILYVFALIFLFNFVV